MKAGYLAVDGQIVDATSSPLCVSVTLMREQSDIKVERIHQDWQDKRAKLAQKDREARSTVKFTKARVIANGKTQKRDIAIATFGFKNHITIDTRHGFIGHYMIKTASAYDGAR